VIDTTYSMLVTSGPTHRYKGNSIRGCIQSMLVNYKIDNKI